MTVPVEEMYMDRIREKLYCSKLPSGLEVVYTAQKGIFETVCHICNKLRLGGHEVLGTR